MALSPFQVTQSPASERSCKASDTDADTVASVLIKNRVSLLFHDGFTDGSQQVRFRQGSEEVGTKTTVRLSFMQSNAASASPARVHLVITSLGFLCELFSKYIWERSYLSLVGERVNCNHSHRECSQITLPKHSSDILCRVHSVPPPCLSCNSSKQHRCSSHLSKQQTTSISAVTA